MSRPTTPFSTGLLRHRVFLPARLGSDQWRALPPKETQRVMQIYRQGLNLLAVAWPERGPLPIATPLTRRG
jgi:hypothetical protein